MSRNPILTEQAFDPSRTGTVRNAPSPAEEWQRAQQIGSGATATADATLQPGVEQPPAGPIVTSGRVMSMGGVSGATFLFLMFVLAGGWFGWQAVSETPVAFPTPDGPDVVATLNNPAMLWIAMFVALGLAILTAFKPRLAMFTGTLYAITEGYLLGSISHLYDARFNGIVVQAILGTLGVFLAMLTLFSLRILRVTPRMTKAIIGATFGIMLLYGFGFLMSIFGVDMRFLYDGSPMGIAISLLIVGVAAFNLLLDFEFIEQGSKAGLPAYMDWYAAFGLLVTLVWLYLEMLRLFARLRQ